MRFYSPLLIDNTWFERMLSMIDSSFWSIRVSDKAIDKEILKELSGKYILYYTIHSDVVTDPQQFLAWLPHVAVGDLCLIDKTLVVHDYP